MAKAKRATRRKRVTKTKKLAPGKKVEKKQALTINTNRFDPYKAYRF